MSANDIDDAKEDCAEDELQEKVDDETFFNELDDAMGEKLTPGLMICKFS